MQRSWVNEPNIRKIEKDDDYRMDVKEVTAPYVCRKRTKTEVRTEGQGGRGKGSVAARIWIALVNPDPTLHIGTKLPSYN